MTATTAVYTELDQGTIRRAREILADDRTGAEAMDWARRCGALEWAVGELLVIAERYVPEPVTNAP